MGGIKSIFGQAQLEPKWHTHFVGYPILGLDGNSVKSVNKVNSVNSAHSVNSVNNVNNVDTGQELIMVLLLILRPAIVGTLLSIVLWVSPGLNLHRYP